MSFQLGKTFKATLEQLHELVQFIKDQAQIVGLSQVSVGRVELAAEEAFVNIIKHGDVTEQGSVEVVCHYCVENGFKITFYDQGIFFDPLANEHACQSENGYGIFLMQYLMDEIQYERRENTNVLTLCKRC